MDKKQLQLLISLAKKLKDEKRNAKEVLMTFVSAGILTKSGNYTKNYPELKQLEEVSK